MMHLFLNGLAASAGGGLTYLRNVLPHLSTRADVRVTAAVHPELRQEFRELPNISLLEFNPSSGVVGRFWQEQSRLPALIEGSSANVLVSTGNFALRKSPVPQILLSRNSLYTSADFFQDLRERRELGLWLDTRIKGRLARSSIRWADRTVAPTEAFAQELRWWTGRAVTAIHHGFDREAFFRDHTPLDAAIRQRLESEPQSEPFSDPLSDPLSNKTPLRLLFVSHYNYYRNFETLFRALPLLRQRLDGRKVKLFLTCRLRSEENPGSYSAKAAASLVTRLDIADNVVELGTVPYSLLHQVYRACSIYVTPTYAESFAHPLVEAMASGVPVVAADTGVHREICQDAAVYFQRFSPEDLAERVCQIATSDQLARMLADRGLERSRRFSWKRHVDELLNLARNLLATIDPARGCESSAGTRYKAS
jgi:glycosyltransferase involved in cell wall biosynthesis